MRNKTGGPAFPTPRFTMDGEGRVLGFSISTDGMSLRDYFAGQAMQTMVQGKGAANLEQGGYTAVSMMAYRMADAMLKAREE
jgi:hypothetical protein